MIKKLGEGTFSEVFKAQSLKTGTFVAIKCMKNSFNSIELLSKELSQPVKPFFESEYLSTRASKRALFLSLFVKFNNGDVPVNFSYDRYDYDFTVNNDVKQIVKEEMENVIKLKVPLLAEVEEGYNWYEAK